MNFPASELSPTPHGLIETGNQILQALNVLQSQVVLALYRFAHFLDQLFQLLRVHQQVVKEP